MHEPRIDADRCPVATKPMSRANDYRYSYRCLLAVATVAGNPVILAGV